MNSVLAGLVAAIFAAIAGSMLINRYDRAVRTCRVCKVLMDLRTDKLEVLKTVAKGAAAFFAYQAVGNVVPDVVGEHIKHEVGKLAAEHAGHAAEDVLPAGTMQYFQCPTCGRRRPNETAGCGSWFAVLCILPLLVGVVTYSIADATPAVMYTSSTDESRSPSTADKAPSIAREFRALPTAQIGPSWSELLDQISPAENMEEARAVMGRTGRSLHERLADHGRARMHLLRVPKTATEGPEAEKMWRAIDTEQARARQEIVRSLVKSRKEQLGQNAGVQLSGKTATVLNIVSSSCTQELVDDIAGPADSEVQLAGFKRIHCFKGGKKWSKEL
jgi:hypothetical protein